MKGFRFIYLSLILFFVLCGCHQQVLNDKEEQKVKETKSDLTQALDVREAVWEQLTEKQKEHIAGSWKDASVQKITLRESMGQIKDKTFIGKEVYLVDYPSEDSPSLGGIGVYADIKSHRIIGFGYRD
ncbi:hypothetical protein [Rossellomorea vietnamensis]|uniref:hypothetical protein n=1 Tax=Rossellomorea vietnamensis TaxID=218284 RepID=UPI001E63EECE|nr:hypothetical protein [Rossellomorea vietnamensis]MCC5801872.1 hypothetical protein [Rossellomorea vietnamensis]